MVICPICNRPTSYRTFRNRPEEQCVHCGSLSRHRWDWLCIQKVTGKILHVAPENCMKTLFRTIIPKHKYISVDKNPKKADKQADLKHLPFPEETFDFIYCSHVMEHVQYDVIAFHELYRVLKPHCRAFINVPLVYGKTYTHPDAKDPWSRRRYHGSPTHLRQYGKLDYLQLGETAGFKGRYHTPDMPPHHMTRYGIHYHNIACEFVK